MINTKNIKWKSYLEGFALFITFVPNFAWTSALPGYALILLCALIVLSSKKALTYNVRMLPAVIFLLIKILYDCIYYNSTTSYLSFLLLILLLTRNSLKIDIVEHFKTIYAIFLIISILIYICVIFIGIDFTHNIIEPLNKTKDYQYNNYYALVIPANSRDLQVIYRFHAVFDEPGVVGNIAIMLLIIDKFKLNSWKNFVIFLSGVFSFSMFFYVITIFCLTFKIIINHSIKINGKQILFITVIIASCLYIINYGPNIDIDLNQLVGNRMSIKENKFSGDNRSSYAFDIVYKDFIDSPNVFFGMGPNAHNKIDSGIQTYKMIIYDNGLLYFLLSLLIMVTYGLAICKNNKKLFVFYLLFILSFYYQRPSFLFVPGFFLLMTTIPLEYIKHSKYKTHRI